MTRNEVEGSRVVAVIDLVGRALLLQLAFVLLSLPLVTALPAACALQRRLDALVAGEGGGVRAMASETLAAWRSCWPLGVLAPVAVAALAQGLWFWWRWPSPVRELATGVLAMVAGLLVALYLALLVRVRSGLDASATRLVREASGQLAARPLRVLWALVVVLTWWALAAFLPTLLLVGSGLVPALAVRLALPAQATRS